jgi:hypothetical protein
MQAVVGYVHAVGKPDGLPVTMLVGGCRHGSPVFSCALKGGHRMRPALFFWIEAALFLRGQSGNGVPTHYT